MTQTPLQEAIQNFKSQIKGNNSINDQNLHIIVSYLESLLPKEKLFVEKVFQAGADWATEVLNSYARRPKEPDVNQFLNHLYPEK